MKLQAFEVEVSARQEDLATALLWEAGTAGIEVREGTRGRRVLRSYFPARRASTASLRARLGALPGARVKSVRVPEVDWVARFREGFAPFMVGGFSIVPAWRASRPAASGRVIRMDPGRAFGTGTHASTRLCLRALEELAAEAPLGRVADLGAGTGILAIGALRLGARAATAVDHDPEAVASARLHARLNRVELRVLRGDLAEPLPRGRFDLVLANLTAALLRSRVAEIAALGAPGARFVLSGMLSSEAAAVRRAWSAVGPASSRRDGEWAALIVHRRPA